jgi:hypothetical protein
MRRRWTLLVIALPAAVLGGCIGRQEMLFRHETTCSAYGFVPGSQGFANCLLQLEMADHGYSHHGRPGSFWPGMAPPPLPGPR